MITAITDSSFLIFYTQDDLREKQIIKYVMN
jgi:hypothetical protein